LGSTVPTIAADPEVLVRMWQKSRSLYQHLAHTADHFWIAEREGQAIGFARSINRGGVRQLTESSFCQTPNQLVWVKNC